MIQMGPISLVRVVCGWEWVRYREEEGYRGLGMRRYKFLEC
jgi:hypothetical protein